MFTDLGADEYKIIFEMCGMWPAFWHVCRSTYTFIKNTWTVETLTGKPLSLGRFSHYVHNRETYETAMLLTPSWQRKSKSGIISIDLINNVIKLKDNDCHKSLSILDDIETGAMKWIADSGNR